MAKKETIILEFDLDMEDSIESIESLTKANKALREERNKLNLSTEQGKKRAQEINAVIDQNTAKIKNNVSAIEKQRLNIGNYASALDNVIPGLSNFIQKGTAAAEATTKMSVATKLLLGPIGLLIIAVTAIIKWLTGSEEGMDKLAIAMAKVSAVVNVITDRLIQLGGALFKFLTGDFSGGIDGIKNSFSGMGDEMEREIGLAVDLAERLDILDDLNLALRIRLSEQENVIKNLIIQSRNRTLSEEQRMKLLVQAADLEKRLTGERIALRVAEINIIASEIQLRNSEKQAAQQVGETTIEFAKRIAADNRILLSDREKIADQLDKYNGLLDNQANIQEKIQVQQDAISDKIAANTAERIALAEAEARANREVQRSSIAGIERQDRADPLIGAFETRATVLTNIEDRLQDDLKKRKDKAAKEDIERARKTVEIQKTIEEEKFAAASAVASGIAGLLDEQSEAYKAFASAQVIISTYAAATKAYEAAFLPIPTVASPAIGAAFAAAAILQGFANLAKINGVEFADGGWTGPGNKWDPVGVVHADEYVTPKRVKNLPQAQPHIAALESMRLRGYADGGLVTNSISQPVNDQFALANVIKNLPPAELSVKEVTKVQKRIRVKESISKR